MTKTSRIMTNDSLSSRHQIMEPSVLLGTPCWRRSVMNGMHFQSEKNYINIHDITNGLPICKHILNAVFCKCWPYVRQNWWAIETGHDYFSVSRILKKELSGKLINPITSLSFHRKNLGNLKINQQLIIIKHVNHVTSQRYEK